MSTQPPRSRRLVLRSLLFAFVLLFVVGFVLVYLQRTRKNGPSFRKETQAILQKISRGDAESVYDEASPRFQAVVLRTRFFDMVADIDANLGKFKEILAANPGDLTSGPKGRAGRVTVRVAFDKATTVANFSFHQIDGDWRLLGMSVDVPKELESVVASPQARAERVKAPPAVMKIAASLLARSNPVDGKLVWAEASPAFRESVPLPVFLELLAKRERVLGTYERIVDVIEAGQNPSQSGATLVVVVQYSKMRTTATLSFQQLDESWQLSTYKVIIPVPRIPGTPPPE